MNSDDNRKSWVSQPDVCRCCLAAGGIRDVSASYISEFGTKEIYFELLQDCYGITLSNIRNWGPSRMICLVCVGQLRDACRFREQIIQAETFFNNYLNKSGGQIDILKTEDDAIQNSLTNTYEDVLTPHYEGGEREVQSQQNETNETGKENMVKRNKLKIAKAKRFKKKANKNETYDSDDAPISTWLGKHDISKIDSTDKNLVGLAEANVVQTGLLQKSSCTFVKHVSERKRGMLTCHTVIKDTTACPFRHHKSWFQCFFCSEEFMEFNQLRDHTLQSHSDLDSELKKMKRYPRSLQIEISNLECRDCHLNLTTVSEMRCHLGEIHNKIIYSECIADFKLDVRPYSCHLCKQEFHVFRTLTTHLNEHYANCICDVCGKSYLNSKRLKVHKRTHDAGHYPCSECGKVLTTKISRSNHIENAHSKRQMKCQICFKPMKHYNDRIKHMSEVHDITHKFQCHICGREYNIKHYLATHIRQTHGHKNKKCAECGMAFITNHGLKKHMLKHTGEKPFSCNLCGKAYARSYSLKEHMRAHDSER